MTNTGERNDLNVVSKLFFTILLWLVGMVRVHENFSYSKKAA